LRDFYFLSVSFQIIGEWEDGEYERLEGRLRGDEMSELYSVSYDGENLYSYKMTAQEKLIVEAFRQELMDICNELDIPSGRCVDGTPYRERLKDNDDFLIKYKEDVGYFVLYGERGIFSMGSGFPTRNKEEAKFILLEGEFENGGFQYELQLRDKLQTEWTKRYSVEYDSRKAAFEYSLKMLNNVFKCFPEKIETQYTNYMNRWFEAKHWYFDKSKMSFEEL